jgi:predicted NAD/FAD-dependent oxidoreductase
MLGRYGSQGDVLAPSLGWSHAFRSAAHGISATCGVEVCTVTYDNGEIIAHADDGRTWRGDGAVIATGPRSAAALLAPHLPPTSELVHWLQSVALCPSWTLALSVDVAPRRDVFGLFRNAGITNRVAACAIHGAKMQMPPRERDVILAWPTPNAVQEMQRASSQHIAAAMLPEVEQLVPEIRGHVTHARVYRFEEGTPLAQPGFGADRTHVRTLAAEFALPIALAGDYLTAPLIEGAVASGERAAAQLADRFELPSDASSVPNPPPSAHSPSAHSHRS